MVRRVKRGKGIQRVVRTNRQRYASPNNYFFCSYLVTELFYQEGLGHTQDGADDEPVVDKFPMVSDLYGSFKKD